MSTTNVQLAQPGDLFIDFAQELTEEIAERAAEGGVKGIMQYTPYTTLDRPKYGSAREAAIAHRYGMYYMLNWEIEADRALQGYSVGRSDGARNRQACRAMGYPETVSAPVSVDTNTLFGNKDKVSGFVRGHFETDGDLAQNISYLDTDGGRLLEAQGIDVSLWVPGAFYWSTDLYNVLIANRGKSLAERYDAVTAKAAENPQVVCIQFPSTSAFGIRVDMNRVIRPFNVWGPTREIVDTPTRPPVIVTETPPSTQVQEDHMATAHITVEGRNAEFWGTGTLLPDGSVDVVFVTWSGAGEDPDNHFIGDHSASPAVVAQHYVPSTLKRDLVLIGDPSEIVDTTHRWSRDDFFRVS